MSQSTIRKVLECIFVLAFAGVPALSQALEASNRKPRKARAAISWRSLET